MTVAASSGETFRGTGMLATYAAGIATPLFLMALLLAVTPVLAAAEWAARRANHARRRLGGETAF